MHWYEMLEPKFCCYNYILCFSFQTFQWILWTVLFLDILMKAENIITLWNCTVFQFIRKDEIKLLWFVQFLLKIIPFLWEFVANNAQENPGVLLLKIPGVGVFKIRENPGVFGVGVPRGGNPSWYRLNL